MIFLPHKTAPMTVMLQKAVQLALGAIKVPVISAFP